MLTLQVITHTNSARSGHPQPSTSLHGKPLSEQEHGISLAALRPAQHRCRTRHAASPPPPLKPPAFAGRHVELLLAACLRAFHASLSHPVPLQSLHDLSLVLPQLVCRLCPASPAHRAPFVHPPRCSGQGETCPGPFPPSNHQLWGCLHPPGASP